VPLSPGGLATWPGAVPLLPGAVPLLPGDVSERPGAFLMCPGELWACPLWVADARAAPFPFFAFLAALPFLACEAFAVSAVEVVEQGPIVSPWRRWAGRAFRETVIVTNGCFAECVWWQIVTLLAYWDAAAGVADGDSAAPIDAEAPTTRALIDPIAALRPQPRLEDRVISLDSSSQSWSTTARERRWYTAARCVYTRSRPIRWLSR
jgi:hypothetical protein